MYSSYVGVEPNRTSIILQAIDVSVNHFSKAKYQRECTSTLGAMSLLRKSFDDKEHLACIVKTVVQLRRERKITVNCV